MAEVQSPKVLRIGLVVLAIPNLTAGLWGLLAPASWYENFPAIGEGWVAAFGPYNEHFIQDIGGAYLAFGLMLVWAAWAYHRKAAQTALVGFLAFSIPHLVIHIFVRAELSARGYTGTLVTLGVGVALALWLLARTTKAAEV